MNERTKTTIQKDPRYLWIGELGEENFIGICIQEESTDFEKIAMGKNDNIEICEYTFEKFAKYSQASPIEPEIFAAQENDAAFLKKRLSEGWDYKTKYRYQNAVSQAAEHNAYEALEILLEHGARLRNNKHRDVPWMYDERTMEILDKYQKD